MIFNIIAKKTSKKLEVYVIFWQKFIFVAIFVLMMQPLKAQNRDVLVSRYQTTAQIAGALLRAIDESAPAAQSLARYFNGYSKLENARLIFVFIKQLLPYNREPAENQTARTLQRIIQDSKKGGDCKHMATTAAALCKALHIPCKLRMIVQDPTTKIPNHIYTVAVINGKEYIIDAVLKAFNNEARYYYKYDISC